MRLLLTILLAVSLTLSGCSTDPLNQKYTQAQGIQPLLDERIKPPIDKQRLGYIIDAELTNRRNGIPNEGKTFSQLEDQGIHLYAERKSTEIVDSVTHKVEAEQRLKADK